MSPGLKLSDITHTAPGGRNVFTVSLVSTQESTECGTDDSLLEVYLCVFMHLNLRHYCFYMKYIFAHSAQGF